MYTDVKILNRSVKNIFCSLYLALKESDFYARMITVSQDPQQADFIGFKTFHEEVQFLFSPSQMDICLMTKFRALNELCPQITHICKTYMRHRDSHANYGDERKKTLETLERMYYMIKGVKELCDYGSYYVPIARYLAQVNIEGAEKYLQLFDDRSLYELADAVEVELTKLSEEVGLNTSKKFVLKHLTSNVDDDDEGDDPRMGNIESKMFVSKLIVTDIIQYAQDHDSCIT